MSYVGVTHGTADAIRIRFRPDQIIHVRCLPVGAGGYGASLIDRGDDGEAVESLVEAFRGHMSSPPITGTWQNDGWGE